MLLFRYLSKTASGISYFTKGCSWLKSHPYYLALLFLPICLSAFLLFISWGALFQYHHLILDSLLFSKPESLLGLSFFYLSKTILSITLILISFLLYPLIVNILSSPIYDYVSCAVEKAHPTFSGNNLPWWHAFILMIEEIKKTLFILLVSIIVLVIPGLNLLSPLITAFFIAWEFCDFPLVRQGKTFRQRLWFVRQHFWSILGFGLWFLIPIVTFLIMPLAVVGGTLLSLNQLTTQ